jgi:putative phosphoribosyl transferase
MNPFVGKLRRRLALGAWRFAFAGDSMNDNGINRRFRDRTEAGRLLTSHLARYADRPNVLILALPRGGVPVAFEIARALKLPLDVFLVRKLGVPGQEELAMGAVASGNVRILQADVIEGLGIPRSVIEAVTADETPELARGERAFRGDRPRPQVCGRDIILVDDGLATGSTMRAAVTALKLQSPERIIVAVPVADSETCDEIKNEVDEIICLRTPTSFYAVGLWYETFPQLTDEEVREFLRKADELWASPNSDRGIRVA